MNIQNKVKKGDVVAIEIWQSATYAFGSGRGTETSKVLELAVVERASREGEAKLLRRIGCNAKRSPIDLRATVHTISNKWQDAAQRMFAKLGWEAREFESPEALRQALWDENFKLAEAN